MTTRRVQRDLYLAQRALGDVDAARRGPETVPAERHVRAGCHPSRSHHARGLCYPCYRRAWDACAFISNPNRSPRHWTITVVRDPGADPIAVERLIDGQPVHATTAERVEAALRLTQRGYSASAIAERLHIAARTVVRYRGKARAA